ncbi:hypothetical protein HAX54_000946 [Datura stramonium]|uniref:Uncharacterized protein n=1 Tax=Datura stramonium TaxID=4076 RepID=A0ABS8T2L5_DATST|nr:hypothetical protein [Datura stramonium]
MEALREVEITMLMAEQASMGTTRDTSALKELQLENAQLKDKITTLREQVEDLKQQMLWDQWAANERIDKLLFKIWSLGLPSSVPSTYSFLSYVSANYFCSC